MRYLILFLFPLAALAQKIPTYNTNTFFLTSSNIIKSNVLAGANVAATIGANGQVTIGTTTNLAAGLITVSTNFVFTFTSQNAGTNDAALTNLTINVSGPGELSLYLTNNATFTNFTGVTSGQSSLIEYWIYPQLVSRVITWPVFGDTLGVSIKTNATPVMWTTLTNGVLYRLSMKWRDTNAVFSISAWQ